MFCLRRTYRVASETKSTGYRLCQGTQAPAKKIGRHWRFERAVIENWLRDRMAGASRSESEA